MNKRINYGLAWESHKEGANVINSNVCLTGLVDGPDSNNPFGLHFTLASSSAILFC